MVFVFDSQEYSTGVGVSSFAANLRFETSNPQTSALRGGLYVSSIINSPDARLGKELRSLIEQKYFSDDDTSAFEALTSSMGEIIHLFRQKQTPLELCAISFVGNIAYLVASNGGCVVLIRDGIATSLLPSEESEVKSASGHILNTDIVLMITKDFLEVIPMERLQFLLNEVNDITELREALVDEMVGYKKPIAFQLVQANVSQAPVPDVEEMPTPNSGSIRKKVASLLDKIIGLIPEKRVVVKEDTFDGRQSARSKMPVVLGIILLGVLLVSISFGVRARNTQQKKAEYRDELISAQHQFDESRSLVGINPPRAKELILSAKQTVKDLESRGIEDPELQVLGTSIEQNMGAIAGIYTQAPSTFIDLTLIRADFKGSDLSFSEGVIRILDAENERMTLINAGTKRTENIASLDLLPNALQAAAYAEESFILSSDGIRTVESEISLVVKDEDWSSDNVLIGAFGANLYVVDKGNNKIWRYPGGVSSYGEGQEWLAPGINVDVTDVLSLTIDGKLWLLRANGEVDVYERGLPQRYVIEGVEVGEGFAQLFTDETAESVYLLDINNSRVVVLDKSGLYKGEYQTPELAKATDFVVSEADDRIIFLAENKLLELTLQHN